MSTLETANMINLPDDQLDRDLFLKNLIAQIDSIAALKLEDLPAPRVIAVDAPWGQGKSWLAAALHNALLARSQDPKVILIDAFRFDHHNDAFAVIAAALMKGLRPNAERRRDYLAKAGRVLKATAPVAVKGIATLGAGLLGINAEELSAAAKSAAEAAIDGAADFSEEAVERLFESYSSTQTTHEEFITALAKITTEERDPVVVLIDELDRCRPSFALEILERIKHLFTAPNIVFVLFWNGSALHESIRHTYGQGVHAEAYLSKFVALEVPLRLDSVRDRAKNLRYWSFLERDQSLIKSERHGRYFAERLAEVSEVLNPTLRDVQKAALLYQQVFGQEFSDPLVLAYILLLKITDKRAYEQIRNGDQAAFAREAQRLNPIENCQWPEQIATLRAHLRFLGKPDYYRAQNEKSRGQDIPAEDQEVLYRTSSGRDCRVVGWAIEHTERKLLGR